MNIYDLIPVKIAPLKDEVLKDGIPIEPYDGLKVRLAATHVGYDNENGFHYLDGKPTMESIDSWTTPFPKPVIVHHDRDSDPLGRVYHAERRDFTLPSTDSDKAKGDHPTGVVILDTLITNEDGIKKVLNGEYLTVSVKVESDDIRCSVCDHSVKKGDMCDHKRNEKYDGKKCVWNIGKRTYKEVSFVNEPADQSDSHFAGVVSVDHGEDDIETPDFFECGDSDKEDGFIILMDNHTSEIAVEAIEMNKITDDVEGWTEDDADLFDWLETEVEKELVELKIIDEPLSEKEKKSMDKEGGKFCGPHDPRKGRRSFPIPDCVRVTAALRLLGRYKGPGSKTKIRACIERRARALNCSGSKENKDTTDTTLTEQLRQITEERDSLKDQLSPDNIFTNEAVSGKITEKDAKIAEQTKTIEKQQASIDILEDQLTEARNGSASQVLEDENTKLYLLVHRLRAESLVNMEIITGTQKDFTSNDDPDSARRTYVNELIEQHDSATLADRYMRLTKSHHHGAETRPGTPTTTTDRVGLDNEPQTKNDGKGGKTTIRPETRSERVSRLILGS